MAKNVSSSDIAKTINKEPAITPNTLTIFPNVYKVSSIEVDGFKFLLTSLTDYSFYNLLNLSHFNNAITIC